MKKIHFNQQDADIIASRYLEDGKIISFATETVYGLACDASNFQAVDELYSLKKRDQSKPIAIFLKNLEIAQELLEFNDLALNIAKKYLPGPLTLVLKISNSSNIKLAKNLNLNEDGFLAFRISDNPFVKKLVDKYQGVMAVTSANISGQESATSDIEVEKYFNDSKLDLLICSGNCGSKISSTVAKIPSNKLQILRQGQIFFDL